MRYALMIYTEPGYEETLSEVEREALYAEYLALADDPRCIGAGQLQSAETATSVRVAGGRTLMTDGPFALAGHGPIWIQVRGFARGRRGRSAVRACLLGDGAPQVVDDDVDVRGRLSEPVGHGVVVAGQADRLAGSDALQQTEALGVAAGADHAGGAEVPGDPDGGCRSGGTLVPWTTSTWPISRICAGRGIWSTGSTRVRSMCRRWPAAH